MPGKSRVTSESTVPEGSTVSCAMLRKHRQRQRNRHQTCCRPQLHTVYFMPDSLRALKVKCKANARRNSQTYAASHTPLIRPPVLDPFFDLFTIEVMFKGLLGELHDLVIGGKTQRD